MLTGATFCFQALTLVLWSSMGILSRAAYIVLHWSDYICGLNSQSGTSETFRSFLLKRPAGVRKLTSRSSR